MKFYLLLILIVVILSGCSNQQTEIAQNQQLPQPIQTAESVTFKPVDYLLDKLILNIPHQMIYDRVMWNSTTITFYSKIKENVTSQIIRDAIDAWNK